MLVSILLGAGEASMRVLFTTTAGIGHLHPLVPLARACARGGHEVRIAAPASLGPTLTKRGLHHEPLPDYSPEHLARVEEVMRGLGPPGPGSELPMLREVFGWAKTDSTLDAMRRAVAEFRPDLLIHEAAELSGPLAAEEAGIDHATVAIALRGTVARWVPTMAEGAAELATAIGLPADLQARRVLDVPFLTLVPPNLEEPGTAVPDLAIRYQLTPIHGDAPAPTLPDGGPLVWIALGTETWRMPELTERVAPVLRATTGALPDVRFLLTTGLGDTAPPAMPDNVLVERYVPQEEILPQCDLILGHGGFNTTMAALSHGAPLVVVPLFSTDQFETAARLRAVGAAAVVEEPSPDALTEALERALTSRSMAGAARRLANAMAELPTPDRAIDLLLAATVEARTTLPPRLAGA